MTKNDFQKELNWLQTKLLQKQQWGEIANWSTQSFEQLSEQILEETGILLSISTLKRTLGKVNYSGKPNPNTLNTLARYVGFENWNAAVFQQNSSGNSLNLVSQNELTLSAKTQSNQATQAQNSRHEKKSGFPNKAFVIVVLVCLVGLSGLWIYLQNPSGKEDSKTPISADFQIRKLTKGLPNSVVFSYSVEAKTIGKVQIQQDWDKNRTVNLVNPTGQTTCIYYYPGYFQAKLLWNEKVLKKQDLFIPSDGWVVALKQERIPRYFLPEELVENEKLSVSKSIFRELSEMPEPSWLNYFYVKDFGDFPSENFRAEVDFQHTLASSKTVCQETRISFFFKKGVISLPFSKLGCVGKSYLVIGQNRVDGNSADLSGFGTDFTQSNQLKVSNQNQNLKVSLNGGLIFQYQIREKLGDMIGVRIRFLGAGEIGKVQFWDGNEELRFGR
ncbi:MAG: hypothetical protein ACJAWV_002843 [Flammeovirgaceae bacterium]|jgi:hypothetical protein